MAEFHDAAASSGDVTFKFELFQRSGSFKIRGALSNMLALDESDLRRGVTTVSAGNHAIAVAQAAQILGTSAKVVMIRTANPMRVTAARRLGAEVIFADDSLSGFASVNRITQDEGRTFIHPFEGFRTILGTATVGLEMVAQADGMEAIVVAIGGGSLAAGVATAVKYLNPACMIFGVEPEFADTMHRSFMAGEPARLEHPDTIADSLAPPMALPYSFRLCRQNVDQLVKVSDRAMVQAMKLLFRQLKLAVEPACAAAVAALCGPLKSTLAGKRVGVILCGSNIDIDSYHNLCSGELSVNR
jgi:threonine dehydratase